MGNWLSTLSISFFLEGVSIIFFFLVLFISFFIYLLEKRQTAQKIFPGKINYKFLIITTVFFRIFFAAAKTISQYYVWGQNEFTQFLLPPHQSIKYFIFYSWGHFWINVILSISVAAVFYLLLRGLKKYQERFFEEGETELGFLIALIVGWPVIVIFVPMIFVLAIFLMIFRYFIFKETLIPLGGVFFLAAFITIIWGNQLIKILNLGVLRI